VKEVIVLVYPGIKCINNSVIYETTQKFCFPVTALNMIHSRVVGFEGVFLRALCPILLRPMPKNMYRLL
jgi:hypothetical protein